MKNWETILKKIILTCKKQDRVNSNDAVYFHGWLMSQISPEFADELHQTGTNPLSVSLTVQDEKPVFTVNLLNQWAIEEIEPLLLNSDFVELDLTSSKQKTFEIIDKRTEDLEEKGLATIFYKQDAARLQELQVVTPLAFKSQGEYYNLPDVRFFFQSIMQKYNSIFEQTQHIDIDMLDEICSKVRLVNYSVHSRRYYIHKAYINGFCGRLVFYCKGTQTLANYVAMLLRFAEYSGVGVKTSLGMGAIKLKEEGNND